MRHRKGGSSAHTCVEADASGDRARPARRPEGSPPGTRVSRPAEGCDRLPAVAGPRKVGPGGSTLVCPGLLCEFGTNRRSSAARAGYANVEEPPDHRDFARDFRTAQDHPRCRSGIRKVRLDLTTSVASVLSCDLKRPGAQPFSSVQPGSLVAAFGRAPKTTRVTFRPDAGCSAGSKTDFAVLE